MVNKERVQLLVDALKSGKYQKGRGWLNQGDQEFCCLGVACEVALANGLHLGKENYYDTDNKQYRIGDDVDARMLPHVVRDWFGFDFHDPELTPNDRIRNGYAGQYPASIINDDTDATLAEIGDMFAATYLTNTETNTDTNTENGDN